MWTVIRRRRGEPAGNGEHARKTATHSGGTQVAALGLIRLRNKHRASKNTSQQERRGELAPCSASLQQASWKRRAFRNTQILASKRWLRGSFLPGCREKENEKKPNRSSGHFLRILFSQAGPLSSPAAIPTVLC